jgi:rhodanese-related sulfurtransferase
MDFRLLLVVSVIAVAILEGCISPEYSSLNDIPLPKAKELIEANAGNSTFVLLDVRTPQEYESGHLSGAVNIDYYAKDFRDQIGKMDRSNTYLIYCRTGRRGADAASILKGMGFNNTYNMQGGIEAWKASNFSIVTP